MAIQERGIIPRDLQVFPYFRPILDLRRAIACPAENPSRETFEAVGAFLGLAVKGYQQIQQVGFEGKASKQGLELDAQAEIAWTHFTGMVSPGFLRSQGFQTEDDGKKDGARIAFAGQLQALLTNLVENVEVDDLSSLGAFSEQCADWLAQRPEYFPPQAH